MNENDALLRLFRAESAVSPWKKFLARSACLFLVGELISFAGLLSGACTLLDFFRQTLVSCVASGIASMLVRGRLNSPLGLFLAGIPLALTTSLVSLVASHLHVQNVRDGFLSGQTTRGPGCCAFFVDSHSAKYAEFIVSEFALLRESERSLRALGVGSASDMATSASNLMVRLRQSKEQIDARYTATGCRDKPNPKDSRLLRQRYDALMVSLERGMNGQNGVIP